MARRLFAVLFLVPLFILSTQAKRSLGIFRLLLRRVSPVQDMRMHIKRFLFPQIFIASRRYPSFSPFAKYFAFFAISDTSGFSIDVPEIFTIYAFFKRFHDFFNMST